MEINGSSDYLRGKLFGCKLRQSLGRRSGDLQATLLVPAIPPTREAAISRATAQGRETDERSSRHGSSSPAKMIGQNTRPEMGPKDAL